MVYHRWLRSNWLQRSRRSAKLIRRQRRRLPQQLASGGCVRWVSDVVVFAARLLIALEKRTKVSYVTEHRCGAQVSQSKCKVHSSSFVRKSLKAGDKISLLSQNWSDISRHRCFPSSSFFVRLLEIDAGFQKFTRGARLTFGSCLKKDQQYGVPREITNC